MRDLRPVSCPAHPQRAAPKITGGGAHAAPHAEGPGERKAAARRRNHEHSPFADDEIHPTVEDLQLAFCMGGHEHLGSGSPIQSLPLDLAWAISESAMIWHIPNSKDRRAEDEDILEREVEDAPDGATFILAPGTHLQTRTIRLRRRITIECRQGEGCPCNTVIEMVAPEQAVTVNSPRALACIKGIKLVHTSQLCEGACMEVFKGNLELLRCDLTSKNGVGLAVCGGGAALLHDTIVSDCRESGVVAYLGGRAFLMHSSLHDNGKAGAVASGEGSKVEAEDCTIMQNRVCGFFAFGLGSFVAERCVFFGGAFGVGAPEESQMIQQDCSFKDHSRAPAYFDRSLLNNVSNCSVDHNSEAIRNAIRNAEADRSGVLLLWDAMATCAPFSSRDLHECIIDSDSVSLRSALPCASLPR